MCTLLAHLCEVAWTGLPLDACSNVQVTTSDVRKDLRLTHPFALRSLMMFRNKQPGSKAVQPFPEAVP